MRFGILGCHFATPRAGRAVAGTTVRTTPLRVRSGGYSLFLLRGQGGGLLNLYSEGGCSDAPPSRSQAETSTIPTGRKHASSRDHSRQLSSSRVASNHIVIQKLKYFTASPAPPSMLRRSLRLRGTWRGDGRILPPDVLSVLSFSRRPFLPPDFLSLLPFPYRPFRSRGWGPPSPSPSPSPLDRDRDSDPSSHPATRSPTPSSPSISSRSPVYSTTPLPLDWHHQPPTLATLPQEVLQHPTLTLARRIEWGSVLMGFEQRNAYGVLDEHGQVRAMLVEEGHAFTNTIKRQILAGKRGFSAVLLGRDGTVLLRYRRAFRPLAPTLVVERGDGTVLGEIQTRWHWWRRKYDVYLGTQQVGVVDEAPLGWRPPFFTLAYAMRDEKGKALASIHRDLSLVRDGLLGADAGAYEVSFPTLTSTSTSIPRSSTQRTYVVPGTRGWGLAPEVAGRPLADTERALALGVALAVDFDYFSRRRAGGLGRLLTAPFFFPFGFGGGDGDGDGDGEAVEGGDLEVPSPPPSTRWWNPGVDLDQDTWRDDGDDAFDDEGDRWR